jgi:hypothetical protein
MSGELLQPLQVQEAKTWHDIVALDELWFHLSTDHKLIWLPADTLVLDKEKHMIQFPKLMLTVVWNPHGFHLVDALPKETKFNGSYHVMRILEMVHEWKRHQAPEATRKLIVHADNAHPRWQN